MVWWQRGRSESLIARPAQPVDRPVIADLLARADRLHGNHAVEEQIALLSSGASSVALSGERAVGFLGLHPRAAAGGERWADVSLLGLATTWGTDRTVETLLTASLPAIQAQGVTNLVCLTTEAWLSGTLIEAGFAQIDQVITYLRNNRLGSASAPDKATLRIAGPAEADAILQVNAAAFAPIWRYEDATILSWLLTADHPVVAECAGQIAGFALTSRAGVDGYAQLIRVAVQPAVQGQGIGRRLVTDAIQYALQTGAIGVALNTQASNTTSRHLYEALGFRVIGPAVDVLTYRAG